jgi:hypothetical protein
MTTESPSSQVSQTVRVVLTRDSVCAGDDADAPHEKTVTVPAFLAPSELARVLAEGYLASVAGVGHSWTCVLNGVKIAEITVSDIRALVRETPLSNENRAHFVYHSARY